jgi:hypothetical protein
LEQTTWRGFSARKRRGPKLGISRTTFYDSFVNTGRVRLVELGPRARGAIDDELDALIEEMRAERDTKLAECESETEAT